MSESKPVCELVKNAREVIQFRLGTFKKHRFMDLRIFILQDGKPPCPTQKGLTVSPSLWPQFRKALAQAEVAMIEAGWLDEEDLEIQG